MNSERNSRAGSIRTSLPSIQEPEDLAQSAIFLPGFNPFNSFFPPPLDLEAIIPFTTPIHSPPISPLDLEETMNLGTDTESKGKKVKLNLPKPFNGKCKKLKTFLQDSQMYLLINAETYKMDLKKIAFMISLMEEGDAASWKQQLIEETFDWAILAGTDPNFGTIGNFIGTLKYTFEPYDSKGNALEEMKALRIGDIPIDEHIAKYKMLVTKAKLKDENPIVIDLFWETLSMSLQRWLLTLEKPPKSLKEWYKWASRLNNNYKRMQRILGGTNTGKSGKKDEKKTEGRKWNFSKKDPNTMDVDVMMVEKRERCMKNGLCFKCEKKGHLGRDCLPKEDKKKAPVASFSLRKMKGKDAHTVRGRSASSNVSSDISPSPLYIPPHRR